LKAVALRFLLALKGGTALMILKIDCDVYLFYDSRVNETFCHLIEPQGTFTSLGLKKKKQQKEIGVTL
jgi:hypothetical protein